MATAIIVINKAGKPIREYSSITELANEYRVTDRTVKQYIENGKLFPKGDVFFDYALDVKARR